MFTQTTNYGVITESSILTAQALTYYGHDMTVCTVEITPELASEILAVSPNIRTLSPMNLKKMIRAVKDGRWKPNANPLLFDGEGLLTDGQHRLTTIARTGISHTFVCIFGAPDDYGTGGEVKPRSVADYLKHHGYRGCHALSSVLGGVYAIKQQMALAKPNKKGEVTFVINRQSHPGYNVQSAMELLKMDSPLMLKLVELGQKMGVFCYASVASKIFACAIEQGWPIAVMENFVEMALQDRPFTPEERHPARVLHQWSIRNALRRQPIGSQERGMIVAEAFRRYLLQQTVSLQILQKKDPYDRQLTIPLYEG